MKQDHLWGEIWSIFVLLGLHGPRLALADYPPITTRASIVKDAKTRTVSKEASFMTPSASYPALTLSDSIVRHQSASPRQQRDITPGADLTRHRASRVSCGAAGTPRPNRPTIDQR